MSIKKQEFYEGAALHLLAQRGRVRTLQYRAPLFVINGDPFLLKYSTKTRTPWGFTFTPEEQNLLHQATSSKIIIALICGSDGVATLEHLEYLEIAALRPSSIHLACYRNHGQHYEINGPDGTLGKKVPPSRWQRILDT